jgi:hypothetical protein
MKNALHLILFAGLFASSALLAACAGDTVAPDPDAGKTHTIHGFYAQVDQSLPVHISVGSTTAVGDMTYGQHRTGVAKVGDEITFDLQAQSGSVLASTKAKNRDGYATWIVYGGTGTTNEAIGLVTKLDSIPANLAGLQLINVAANTTPVKLYVEAVGGLQVGNSVNYKSVSSAFTKLPTTIQNLVLTDDKDNILLNVGVKDSLKAGSTYTLILYGNAQSTGVNPVAAQLIQE